MESKLMDRLAVICSRIHRDQREHFTATAFLGDVADYEWKRMLYSMAIDRGPIGLDPYPSGQPVKYMGVLFAADRDSPEPELIKFFVDGAHLYTLNAETLQITEIKPDWGDDMVWKLSALWRLMDVGDKIPFDAPRVVVHKPVNYAEIDLSEQEPTIRTLSLEEMVDNGFLRREPKHYAFTHAGRLAAAAAAHHHARYCAKTNSEIKGIDRGLLQL